jgi:secreted PhoX family phosphatase
MPLTGEETRAHLCADGPVRLSRRTVLKAGILGGALLAMEACAPPGASARFRPVGPPDANGLQLPPGFTARIVARTGDPVGATGYTWHAAPDGGRCFWAPDGWIYVSNSELDGVGGVGMLRFDLAGNLIDARRLLDNTNRNCSGGHTPWGTWLSCEEVADGRVFEVDPFAARVPRTLNAMGRFQHEGAAVDGARQIAYLTEDETTGLFYRYRYSQPNDLSSGVLEAARVDAGVVTWLPVPDPTARRQPTRLQVPGATPFGGAEGIWFDRDVVNFATKFDDKVWAYDVVAGRIAIVYDWTTSANPVIRGVDNLAVRNRDIFVCEDQGVIGNPEDPELCVIEPNGIVSVFLRAVGHRLSELTGAAFNPAGDRLYLSSQRGVDGRGITYEVTGPFPN